MVKTIGNPLSWTARNIAGASRHIKETAERIGGEERATPIVQPLTAADIRAALRLGYADFSAVRSDVMLICLIYPVVGAFLAAIAFNANLLPLVFPAAAGFALIGPFAAIGLYEVSRRREKGEEVTWIAALDVIRSPNFGAVIAMGLYLIALFIAWIVAAYLIWFLTLGPDQPETVSAFLTDVFTTGMGWTLIVVGLATGFCFALAVLATSVVSFPLLLDHNVGVPTAVVTSYRVFRRNPRVIATWGLIVAALLFLGSIPAFIGLIIVVPLLGHSTWHLYRRAVSF